MAGAFIAIDWGTTNRRAYLIDADGTVVAGERDGRGIVAMAGGDYAGEVAALAARLGADRVLCAGMVGSNRGWIEAPYVVAPADLDTLAAGIVWAADSVVIIPGVRTAPGSRADVMRGEEVQLLGAVAAGLAPATALLCQPGTHCKWARIEDTRLTGFATAMTGELFALLKGHALIADLLDGAVADGPAFREGVRDGATRPLTEALFGVRAAWLLGDRSRDDSASYASGLLIGADVAGHVGQGEPVHILADPALGALYAAAVDECGGPSIAVDSQAAFVAGATAIARALGW